MNLTMSGATKSKEEKNMKQYERWEVNVRTYNEKDVLTASPATPQVTKDPFNDSNWWSTETPTDFE